MRIAGSVYAGEFGACTAIGQTAAECAAAVRAGVAAMSEHPRMVDCEGNPIVIANASYLAEELAGADRLVALALEAATQTIESLKTICAQPPLKVIVGLPESRPGLEKTFADDFLEKFGDQLGKRTQVSDCRTICGGHSGGLMAIEAAFRALSGGDNSLYLVGGVDSYIARETLRWLEMSEQLHSETETWGFCPGEGAAFCLLYSENLADALGLQKSNRLLAAANAIEKNRIKTETVCLGEGHTDAFRKLFATPECMTVKVGHIICDFNGEPYRADEFGFAILRTGQHFEETADLETPADCWGDVGAASGPLFLMLAATAAQKGYAKARINLMFTSSEGGSRSAAVVDCPPPGGA